MTAAIVHRIRIHRLAIPMRAAARHAGVERMVSNPVIAEIELANGMRGFGESPVKADVTDSAVSSVTSAIEQVFVPAILQFHPDSFPAALEFIDALPWQGKNGTTIPAVRAAVELALLDVAMRYFQRSVDDIVQWMGLIGFGHPGCLRTARNSRVLAAQDLKSMMRQLRLMCWGGIPNFKLNVGTDGDIDQVRAAAKYLAKSVSQGRGSLRVDANGAWNVDQAAEWLSSMSDVPLAGIEQPLPRGQEESLSELLGGSDALFIHDESLITEEDGRRLIDLDLADVFDIRLGKCGGFLPSLRLAALARKNGVKIQLGCVAGETSILSAAGLRFLQVCPEVQWVEGCYGTYLLRGDVVRKSLRIGYGGRPPKLTAEGWGIDVDDALLANGRLDPPKIFNL